jgi:hypothetical protein
VGARLAFCLHLSTPSLLLTQQRARQVPDNYDIITSRNRWFAAHSSHEIAGLELNMAAGGQQRLIPMPYRVLAGIFAAYFALAAVKASLALLLHKEWRWDPTVSLLMLLGVLVFCPIFLFIALKGRAPRWFTAFEDLFNQIAEPREARVPGTRRFERIPLLVAATVFGAFFICIGIWRGFFDEESRWIVITAFGFAWVITVGVMYWSYRRKRNGQRGSAN